MFKDTLHKPHGTPTFMTEALSFVHDVQHFNGLVLLNQQLTQHYLSHLWHHVLLLRPRLLTPSIANQTGTHYNLFNRLFRFHLTLIVYYSLGMCTYTHMHSLTGPDHYF